MLSAVNKTKYVQEEKETRKSRRRTSFINVKNPQIPSTKDQGTVNRQVTQTKQYRYQGKA